MYALNIISSIFTDVEAYGWWEQVWNDLEIYDLVQYVIFFGAIHWNR